MSIIKNFELPTTVVATYWKIAKIELDTIKKVAEVTIFGYVSKEAKIANESAPVIRKIFNVTIDNVTGNIISQAYSKLKSAPDMRFSRMGQVKEAFFHDGEDDL